MSINNKSNSKSPDPDDRISIVERVRRADLLPRVMQDLLTLPQTPTRGQTVGCVLSDNHKSGDRRPSTVVPKDLDGACVDLPLRRPARRLSVLALSALFMKTAA